MLERTAADASQEARAIAALSARVSPRAMRWAAFIVVAVVAVSMRLFLVDQLPPGLFGDEAVEGLDALDVIAGNWAIWFHAHLGREPIFVYLVALSYKAFGISPLSTRLPAIIAGLITIPAAFFFAREWASGIHGRARANRLAFLATVLLGVSFWHIQMTRDAHRDTLLPLVQTIGYALLWYALRSGRWQAYAAAGGLLGLAIYTYSPGRFVSVFILLFFLCEWLAGRLGLERLKTDTRGLVLAGTVALLVMLPLGIYFAQNPAQFSRRFDSVSVMDSESPLSALLASLTGNLAQFVIPGMGYQSKHYNLPGKPVFDLFIAPWFLVGIGIAAIRIRRAEYRFVLLWFAVLLAPAFLTSDMIPKAVRALGTVPGVFLFPALAMDAALESVGNWRKISVMLISLCLVGSTFWTGYDYFVAWAGMPELPLSFDTDLAEVSDLIQRQPPNQDIHISTEVYRPPTEMLLGRHIPTSRYVDPATRIKEFDARTVLLLGRNGSDPLYVFVRDRRPPPAWLSRLANEIEGAEEGTYYQAVHLRRMATPLRTATVTFNPLLKLVGYSWFADEPQGIAVYWEVLSLPGDREEMSGRLVLGTNSGQVVREARQPLGVPPLEWASGDSFIEWYVLQDIEGATRFRIELTRGKDSWETVWLPLQ